MSGFFSGYVEALADDRHAVIRFGESIICINTVGVAFTIGEFVKLEVNKVEFYDIDL